MKQRYNLTGNVSEPSGPIEKVTGGNNATDGKTWRGRDGTNQGEKQK